MPTAGTSAAVQAPIGESRSQHRWEEMLGSLAEGPLCRSTAAAGWAVTAYDDAPHRFFAVAERR